MDRAACIQPCARSARSRAASFVAALLYLKVQKLPDYSATCSLLVGLLTVAVREVQLACDKDASQAIVLGSNTRNCSALFEYCKSYTLNAQCELIPWSSSELAKLRYGRSS